MSTFRRVFLAAPLLAIMISSGFAQDVIEGRLEDGDEQLSMNEYYDAYPFGGVEGQAYKFEIISPDFLPGGMLYDPDQTRVDYSLGSAIDKAWATECRLTATGTWYIVVFQSYWLEGDYTLSITPSEGSADTRRCDE